MSSGVPSEAHELADAIDLEEEPRPISRASLSSLKERMRAHREEVESRTTEIFPVPNWDGILAVELMVAPWEETEQAMQRHMRRPSRQMLNTAADEICAATVAFYAISEGAEEFELIEDARSWAQILTDFTGKELPPGPPTTLDRVALINLLTEQGVMALSTTYRRWMVGAKTGIAEEVKGDFGTTP